MRPLVRILAVVAAAGVAIPIDVLAQPQASVQTPTLPPAAVPGPEAAAIAQGWVLLAEGKFDEASRIAKSAASRFPRSLAAFGLLIDAEIARLGATTALDVYEGWLGSRTLEEPAALRRVARAFLYEWARQARDLATRDAALLALAEDGDEQARAVIAAGTSDLAQAKLGDAAAIDRLSTRLKAAQGLKLREIHSLAHTGSDRAVAPLVGVLADPRPENRAAAAEGLGTLGDAGAVAALKPLLQDPHGAVRMSAAGALFRLGDPSGAPLLEELAASEHATMRRSAAVLMASQPDEAWKALVRGLASDADPSIRLEAAELMAPHDPEFSRAIFQRLSNDSNLTIRDAAALALAEADGATLTDLRRLLRNAAGPVKVRAADRVLALTR